MEITAFWLGCVALGLFFSLTTRIQRARWILNGWTVLLLAGGVGLAFELLR